MRTLKNEEITALKGMLTELSKKRSCQASNSDICT